MKIDVEITSKFTIKPSSPTPPHLSHYTLSFLDQIAPPVFMPLVLFYPAEGLNDNLPEKSNHLKNSLSDAVARFYPLAGRVVNDLYVDCNDVGVPYVEAEARCWLSEVITDPIPGELNKLLPCELDDVRDIPMVVQVTFFECGGIAVGVGISHKIADALSLLMFITTWGALARGETNIPIPHFKSTALFPPVDTTGFKPSTGIVKDNIVTKRFVFTASKISALRDMFGDQNAGGGDCYRPTRIETLSAFIWIRFMAATQAYKSKGDKKIYSLLHAVNLRPRVNPPLPESYFGNISRLAIAVPSLKKGEKGGYHRVVSQIRDAIRKVNGDYVEKLREGNKHLSFMKERAKQTTMGEVISFSFTSLCRFPLYEADFGWGKPVWVGSASLTFKNLVTFMDTRTGDGLEAWVNMKREDMAKFEMDKEILEFVSPSPTTKGRF